MDATSYTDAVGRIADWAARGESRYVCVCNVHMVMEAHDESEFATIVRGADLVTPDGVPLVWALRLLGVAEAVRVYGPDLMAAVCEYCRDNRISIGLYGASQPVVDLLVTRLERAYRGIRIGYAKAPPFRPLDELVADGSDIARSGARVLFVALGCPKQERWMAAQRGRLPLVMIGVGAAFDFIAGTKPQAPRFLQRLGLEWAFRLLTEPRRLARRYFVHNPRFVWLFVRQFVTGLVTARSR